MSEPTSFVDYYELLGVEPNARVETIRAAFLELAKTNHPDVGGSTKDMQQYTQAYRTLMSASSRKRYDLLHDFHIGHSKIQYRDYGTTPGTSVEDLSDDEIDDFLDQVFRDYHTQPKPRPTLLSRLRQFL